MIPESQQSLKTSWLIAGGVFVGVIVIALGLFVSQIVRYMRSIDAGEANPFKKDQRQLLVQHLLDQPGIPADVLTRIDPHTTAYPTSGNPDAPIRMVEFLDYECPFCRSTSKPLREFMRRHAADVLLVARDFPLEDIHPGAFRAALAARCVFEQGDLERFWRYHDRLFQDIDGLTQEDLRASALDMGADMPRFDACVADSSTASEVRRSMQDGVEAGIRGTPTFFVNGKKIQGALDTETLELIYAETKTRLER